jgi:adenine-specific DNA-methyltransferase
MYEEYYYLLASLLEGVPFVSNITGTYGAYLKDWDKRALKKFEMLRFNIKNNNYDNKCYNVDSNNLIKEIRGDILYIDPPYNSRQYLPNYHLLETIAKYDSPKLIGKTGIREYEEEKSKYCTKSEASTQLEDLIQNAKFNHIILSYNQDGILEKEQIEAILKKYGEKNTYKFYEIPYKKYLNKLTKKADVHFEYVFYIKKKLYDNTNCIIHSIELKEDCQVNEANEIYNITERGKFLKSPLNYIGGKYKLLPQLLKYFPKEANTFIDLFAGGFNVGLNYNSKKTICNDINNFIIDLYKKLYESKINDVLKHIDMRIKEYSLTKENEMGFKKFREYYNETRNPIDLYLLTCFSFNYQFRFNNSKKYNNPFGRNRSQYSEPMKKNLILFMNKIKDMNIEFTTEDFENININNLNSKDFIYCDPPYLITNASYNDGNRGFKDWKDTEEIKLYNFLDRVNNQGIKFAMTNVVEHKGKENVLLKEWSKKYNTINLYSDYSNSSYNTKKGESKEVLITNYNM